MLTLTGIVAGSLALAGCSALSSVSFDDNPDAGASGKEDDQTQILEHMLGPAPFPDARDTSYAHYVFESPDSLLYPSSCDSAGACSAPDSSRASSAPSLPPAPLASAASGLAASSLLSSSSAPSLPSAPAAAPHTDAAGSAIASGTTRYPIYSVVGGLDLDGTTIGVGIERRLSLLEFSFSQKSYVLQGTRIPFGVGWQSSTALGYAYSGDNVKAITFALKTYQKNDFEFIDANWKWGIGAGLDFLLSSRQVTLADSSVVSALYQTQVYPTFSMFVDIYPDKSEPAGVRFGYDFNIMNPPSIQFSFLFVFNLP